MKTCETADLVLADYSNSLMTLTKFFSIDFGITRQGYFEGHRRDAALTFDNVAPNQRI